MFGAAWLAPPWDFAAHASKAMRAMGPAVTGAKKGQSLVRLDQALESFVSASSVCQSDKLFGSTGSGWYVCEHPALYEHDCEVVGVGIGNDDTFEVEFARAFPNCNVTMIDPTPSVVDYYRRSPPMLPNLHFLPWALGRSDGLLMFPKNGYNEKPVQVQQHTLAALGIRKNPLTLIKLDIEGAEWSLFNSTNSRGSGCCLSSHTVWTDQGRWTPQQMFGSQEHNLPYMLIMELHDGPPIAWGHLIDVLAEHGYSLWRVTNPRFGKRKQLGYRFPRMPGLLAALAELYFVRGSRGALAPASASTGAAQRWVQEKIRGRNRNAAAAGLIHQGTAAGGAHSGAA